MMSSDTTVKLLLLVLSFTWGGWMISLAIGRWTRGQEGDVRVLTSDITRAHQRLDHAGLKMSDLAGDLQGIETRMRKEFVPMLLAEEWLRDSRHDREQLWKAIDRLGGGRRHDR